MADPTLPQDNVEVPAFSIPSGTEHFPTTASELQTAVNNAALNDVIWLEAGTDYDFGSSSFTLPNKTSGSGWIYIISDAYLNLPAEGYRVAPSDATDMARLSCNAMSQFVVTDNVAHHYRLVGLHIEANTNQTVTRYMHLQGSGTDANQPHHILVDRCYIHGQDGTGTANIGVRMNGKHIGIINCYIDNFRNTGADTQAIHTFQCTGPLLIRNNYLEGAGENYMSGGANSGSAAMIPRDITFEYNLVEKREAWRGSGQVIKNLWESKCSYRTLIQYNVFTNVWVAGQDGAVFNWTSNAEGNGHTYMQTTDITCRYNVMKRCHVGFGMAGTSEFGEDLMTNVLAEHNVVIVGEQSGGGNDCINKIADASPVNVTVRRNTMIIEAATGNAAFFEHLTPAPDFTMTDNIVSRGNGGVDGTGSNEGTDALNDHHTTYVFTTNAVIGASSGSYPSGNYFPANLAAVNLVNYQADGSGDYSITPGTTYAAGGASDASDGTDLGAHWNTFKAHIMAALNGTPVQADVSSQLLMSQIAL
jgi:hypothetical protein